MLPGQDTKQKIAVRPNQARAELPTTIVKMAVCGIENTTLNIIKCVALFCKLGATIDFIRTENVCIELHCSVKEVLHLQQLIQ